MLVADRTWRIAAGAGFWALAAAVLGWLVVRAHRKDRAQQQELDRAETRHRALLEGLPLVTWLTEPGDRGSTLYVSPSIEELTGYSPAEWANGSGLFEKLLHPEDRERVLAEPPTRPRLGSTTACSRATAVPSGCARRARSSATRPASRCTCRASSAISASSRRAEDEREQFSAAERAATTEVTERQARLDLLRRAGDELASTLEQQRALTRVADLIVREFADWCVIDVVEDGNAHELTRVAVARAEPAEGNGARRVGDSPGASIRAVTYDGRSRLVPSPGEDRAGEPVRFLEGLEARSVISVPLRARKQPFGALTVARTVRGDAYGADDLALVEDLAVTDRPRPRPGAARPRGRGAGRRRPRA